jgi:hypothetical protein
MIPSFTNRYGDLCYLNMGSFNGIAVCDYEMMKEMLSQDMFSMRGNPADMGLTFFKALKGGHGSHGLIGSEGKVEVPSIPVSSKLKAR